MELAVEPVSIRRTVEACIDIVALEAQHKGLSMSYSLDTQLPHYHLMADPIRLRQVSVRGMNRLRLQGCLLDVDT